MQSLLAYCERELPWLLETIEALVRLESPSGDAAAINRCWRNSHPGSTGSGAIVTPPARRARRRPSPAEFGSGARQVLLLGHIDTVWPVGTLAARPFRAEGGRLHGPGVFDMKAGLAMAALALKALAEGPDELPGRSCCS